MAVRVACAALGLIAALISAACQQILGPSNPDSNWTVVDSPRFALHVRPGSFAQESAPRLLEVLEDQYTAALDRLDLRFDRRVSAFLYNSVSEADLGPGITGAAYSQTYAFSAVCTPPLDDELLALVGHEATHVIVAGALGRPGTSMMSEGLASGLLSERHHSFGTRFYHRSVREIRSQMPAIAELTDDGKWAQVPRHVSYTAAASFLAYLLETHGRDRLKLLYYARSSEFAARFAEIYGRSLADAESQWLVFVERQP